MGPAQRTGGGAEDAGVVEEAPDLRAFGLGNDPARQSRSFRALQRFVQTIPGTATAHHHMPIRLTNDSVPIYDF